LLDPALTGTDQPQAAARMSICGIGLRRMQSGVEEQAWHQSLSAAHKKPLIPKLFLSGFSEEYA